MRIQEDFITTEFYEIKLFLEQKMAQGNSALCTVHKSKSTVKYLEHYTRVSGFPCFSLFFVSREPRDTLMASGKRELNHY